VVIYAIYNIDFSDCGKREKEESKWKGKRNWRNTDMKITWEKNIIINTCISVMECYMSQI
jgi:hypothetical protein